MKSYPGLSRQKQQFNMKTLLTSKLELNLRKNLVMFYIWSIALKDAENLTLCKVDQRYLERLEMWCWRWTEIMLTDRVKNEVLHKVKEEGNTEMK